MASVKQAEETLGKGFTWAQDDRYKFAECARDPQASELAACLERESYHTMPVAARAVLYAAVDKLYALIPVRVLFVPMEPYFSCEEMSRDVRDNSQIRVRHHKGGHLGARTEKFRAVHDYFGHVTGDKPFTFSGELGAYIRHVVQFPRVCWPYVFSNVVLENAYRLNRGHFLCYPKTRACPAKVVFAVEEFGAAHRFYDNALS